jgi:S-adenosylmethionine:tRNA ribosyltransferase-isomerase
MDLKDLDFELPDANIAQRPLERRDASRLLLLDRASGAWTDRQFQDFPELLRGDELIVLNNARVLPARLFGRRVDMTAEAIGTNSPGRNESLTTRIELLLVRALGDGRWEALARPARKLPVGARIVFGEGELEARVEARGDHGLRVVKLESRGDLGQTLERLGHIPLPPYIKRADDAADRERYQTVYARQGQAVAAPTAGLHFTPEILRRARARGALFAEITLDVGLGTFEPLRTEQIEDHKIHKESYQISPDAAQAIALARHEGRPILAAGTTVVRALEDAASRNVHGEIVAGRFEANIFLYPGKAFRSTDQLLTNFHLPRSSLLAMVAAFAGRKRVLAAYQHAVKSGYRFYSYGDCMLIR